MRAEPLRRAEGGAVVTHWDITARKVIEIALRESEDRFRRMADPLPVAIWMSEADGGRSYVNKEWLQMTGRTLDDERGDGWLESVHSDDREACVDEYRRASELREGFRMSTGFGGATASTGGSSTPGCRATAATARSTDTSAAASTSRSGRKPSACCAA